MGRFRDLVHRRSHLARTPYTYTALSDRPRAIRLLFVEPGVGNKAVHCALLHADLDRIPRPAYETMSYCWGDENVRDELFVDGHIFDAPASSVAAIRRIRLKKRRRTIWIDAICIDQSNIEERNRQVPLMKDIYSMGQGNLIYLGEPDGSEADAFSCVEMLLKDAAAETNDFAEFAERTLPFNFRYLEQPAELLSKTSALISLYSRPWFSRVWVVQEAVLSPTNTCLLGSRETPFLPLCAAAAWMIHKYRLFDFTVLYAVADLLRVVDSTGKFREPRSTESLPMCDLLILQRSLNVTNPRDRVYGVLGILKPSEDGSPLEELIVDYDKPVAMVMANASRIALSELPPALHYILSRVSHRVIAELDETWPSWVPRWDRAVDGGQDPPFLNAVLFDASAGTSIMLDLLGVNTNTGLLHVRGIRIAQVEKCSLPLSWDSIDDITSYLFWLEQAQRMSGKPTEAVGVTLVAGTTSEHQRCSDAYGEKLQSLINYMRDKRQLPGLGTGDAHVDALAEYETALRKTSRIRRFLVTTSGLIGVGPKITEPGDIVAVLYGSQLPFILRPHGEHYQLIGDCYVHGIMDGEAVHEHRASGRPDEDFVLC